MVGKGEVNDVEVGDDKGELLLDYSLFIRLNAKAKAGGVTQEQFVAKPIATRKAFEEACKLKYKEDLDGIKGHNERFTVLKNMWTERFERKRTWCVERGRVMEYVRFIKDNKDTLRRCSLSPSIVWGNYNQTWNALCGTEVVKLRTPRAGKEEEEPEPEPEKKADKKRKARPVETSEEEEPAAGGAAAEEAEEEEDSEDA